jgi:4-oxalocrotonate tautomerase
LRGRDLLASHLWLLKLSSHITEKTMPFVRISLPQVISDEQLVAVSNAVHTSMVQTFNVPNDDRFQVVTRHPPAELIYAGEYLGVKHSSRIAFIQITCNEGRTVEMKKALFAELASSIHQAAPIATADVIVSLVEVKKENWSFGNGVAQYAT